uniref:F-box domain-containing protein n=1 Tax=Mycena chlorophos TaxID=658473 RepID=A0ABQ0LE57_MYCCL|nr:predicted protein [Mycena chlorophos]
MASGTFVRHSLAEILSPETLERIFDHLVPPTFQTIGRHWQSSRLRGVNARENVMNLMRLNLLVAAAVCRVWRRVALGQPHFWDTLEIDCILLQEMQRRLRIFDPSLRVKALQSFIERLLARSGTLPLTIHLLVDNRNGVSFAHHVWELLSAVPVAARWQVLNVCFRHPAQPFPVYSPKFTAAGPFPLLQQLHLAQRAAFSIDLRPPTGPSPAPLLRFLLTTPQRPWSIDPMIVPAPTEEDPNATRSLPMLIRLIPRTLECVFLTRPDPDGITPQTLFDDLRQIREFAQPVHLAVSLCRPMNGTVCYRCVESFELDITLHNSDLNECSVLFDTMLRRVVAQKLDSFTVAARTTKQGQVLRIAVDALLALVGASSRLIPLTRLRLINVVLVPHISQPLETELASIPPLKLSQPWKSMALPAFAFITHLTMSDILQPCRAAEDLTDLDPPCLQRIVFTNALFLQFACFHRTLLPRLSDWTCYTRLMFSPAALGIMVVSRPALNVHLMVYDRVVSAKQEQLVELRKIKRVDVVSVRSFEERASKSAWNVFW